MKARTKKKRYRVAIVGCGKIAGGYDMPRSKNRGKIRTHVKAYLADPRFEMVAACDRNTARLKRFCAHWNIPRAYTSLETMLRREKPDVVSVCVPIRAHKRVLEVIARHPVRLVFAEKPFTESVRDAKSVLKKFKAAGTSVAVNYLRRWCPNHRKLKRIIHSGRLGRLRLFDAVYSGSLANIGSHLIDLIDFLAGRITAVRGSHGGKTGELILCGGISGYLERSARDQFALELLFDRGLVRITRYGYAGECIVWRNKIARITPSVACRFGDFSRGIDVAVKHAIENIGDHLKRRTPLLSGSENTLQTLQVIEALRKSSRSHKTVGLH